MPFTFLAFAMATFVSGFALRLVDPIVLPLAQYYGVRPELAAALTTAYALPYAMAQPFLGALGDRFSKVRCMQVCSTGLALALACGWMAPSFSWLMASRIVAGVFAGGLIPLVLASLGERYAMVERQVRIGHMLFAIISGQMLGSVVAGLANDYLGWRSALAISTGLTVLASAMLWRESAAVPASQARASGGLWAPYGEVFRNPRAVWIYGCALAEGVLFFSFFPYVGAWLDGQGSGASAGAAGLVLGAFGVGGLLYAVMVRRLLGWLGAPRMCLLGSLAAAGCHAAMPLFSSAVWAGGAMLLAGFTFYMIHNSLQAQVTELAPGARGSAVALFACGLFAGQGLGPLLFGAAVKHAGFTACLLGLAVGLLVLGQVVVRRVIPAAPGGRAQPA